MYKHLTPAGEILKPGTKHAPLPADAGQQSIARLDELRNAKGELRTADIRRNMQKSMQRDAAVFRTQVRPQCNAPFRNGLAAYYDHIARVAACVVLRIQYEEAIKRIACLFVRCR